MTTTVYGEKYNEKLDVAEIADLLRAEIKADVKAGKLPRAKYSVRIERFSGGTSITVRVSAIPFPILNRDAYELRPYGLSRKMDAGLHHNEAGRALERELEKRLAAYNYDGSDIQSDYFHVNFYAHVRLEDQAEMVALEEDLKAAARGEVVATPANDVDPDTKTLLAAPRAVLLAAHGMDPEPAAQPTARPYLVAATGWDD